MKLRNKIAAFIVDKFWLTTAIFLGAAAFCLISIWHLIFLTKFGQWVVDNFRLVVAILFSVLALIVFFIICLVRWDWNEKDYNDNF